MASRIRVASLIVRHREVRGPRRNLLSRLLSGFRNLCPPCTSNLSSCQVFSAPTEADMSIPAAWPQTLDFFGTPLVIEPSQGQLSSNAGLLPIRQFDDRIGLTRAFTDALDGPRDPHR